MLGMTRSSHLVRCLAAALLPVVTHAQIARREARVEVTVPKPPQPATVNGQRVLVYELHVTNFGPALGLREIDVFADSASPTPLATFRDSMLTSMLQPGSAINPYSRTVAYLWVVLDPHQAVPGTLRHRLLFDILDTAAVRRDGGTLAAIDNILVPLMHATPLVIRAPLDSGLWLAGSSPSNTSDHRRSLTALAGRASISQRFAIDWARIGPNGDVYHDDEHKNEDFWGFGQPARAVAAGEVVALLDSIADNTPHTALPPVTPRTIAGNFVTIRIGPRQYATYAHLQRGSIRVHVHQQVPPGEVIALVGNSGQTTGAHLHFQITDAPPVLASEGIPYILPRFTFLGYAKDFELNKHPSVPRRNDLPGDEAVVALP